MRAALWKVLPSLALVPGISPAFAGETRDLCPDRPGLGTPACTVPPGTVVGELGLADWTREDSGGSRIDTILAGEALLRVGLADSLEGQFGWTAFGHVRSRDRLAGTIDRGEDVGDVTIALRRNLRNPDGSGFSIAVMPYVSLPVGGAPVGAGDWGGGLLVPISFELTDSLSLALTPGIDAAVDGDGHGRHLGFGGVAGLGFAVSDRFSASTEVSIYRDHDPAGHATEALLGLSAAWQPDDAMQFDVGVNLGLNASSADSQLYFGIARRF